MKQQPIVKPEDWGVTFPLTRSTGPEVARLIIRSGVHGTDSVFVQLPDGDTLPLEIADVQLVTHDVGPRARHYAILKLPLEHVEAELTQERTYQP